MNAGEGAGSKKRQVVLVQRIKLQRDRHMVSQLSYGTNKIRRETTIYIASCLKTYLYSL
jgi:hypothetical protein